MMNHNIKSQGDRSVWNQNNMIEVVYLVWLSSFMENAGIDSCRHQIIGCGYRMDVSCEVEVKLNAKNNVSE